MADLVKAIGDFIAAVLSLVGFIGKPRRRTAIREDLQLLRELNEFEEFERGSWPYTWLTNHIALQIAEFSGLDLRTERRKIPWGSVVVATAMWVPLGWLTYYLVSHNEAWFTPLPAIPGGILFITTMTMLGQKEEVIPPGDDERNEPPLDAEPPRDA